MTGRLICWTVLLLYSLCALAEPPLRIGISETHPFREIVSSENWARYLQERLGRQVRIVFRPGHNDVLNLLLSDRVDFAWICTAQYLRHHVQLPLVSVPEFRNQPLYQMLLLADATVMPPVQNLGDLGNTVAAFAEPDTNFGSHLVLQALSGQVDDPKAFFRRIIYTGRHSTVLDAVSSGMAHSGAVVNQVWDHFRKKNPDIAGQMRVVWQSEWRPLPPIVGAPATSSRLARDFQAALLDMNNHPAGKQLLARFYVDRFIAADDALYIPRAPGALNKPDASSCPELLD